MPTVPMTRPLVGPKPARLVIRPPVPALESIGLTLMDLRLTSCRYIISVERGVENVLYCGAPATRGAYCAHHAHLCYEPPARRR